MQKKFKCGVVLAVLVLVSCMTGAASAANVYNVTDDSYGNYFNSSGYINDTNIQSGDVLDCYGTLTNKSMYIDRPLNITSSTKTGKIVNGTITVLASGSGTNITDLKINNTIDGVLGICLNNTENNTIKGNTIQSDGSGGYGILLSESNHNNILENNLSEYGTVDGWRHSPILLAKSNYNNIMNNYVLSRVSNCIYLCGYGTGGVLCYYNNIVNNTCIGVDTSWCYAIEMMGSYNTAINNTITVSSLGAGVYGEGAYRGISSENDDEGGNTIVGNNVTATYCGIYATSNCKVSGNTVSLYRDSRTADYSGSNPNAPNGITAGPNCTVTDNVINAFNSGCGIQLTDSNTTFTGNNITTDGYGIYFSVPCSSINITGNNITTTGTNEGIYIPGVSRNNTIFGNNINSNSTGVLLKKNSVMEYPTNTSVTNNKIVTKGTYAVESTAGNGSSITNNYLVSDNGSKLGNAAVNSGSTDTVTGNYGGVPVAGFTTNITNGTSPLNVQFTDTSSNNPTSWSWDFGDGATSAEQSPSHTYTGYGDYTVKLTVTNFGGSNTLTKTDYITIPFSISGTVCDAYDNSTGNYVSAYDYAVPVANATVNLRDQNTKKILSTTSTDSSGSYVFNNLAKGDYTVEILYRTYENFVENVTLNATSLTVNHTFVPDIAIISYYGTSSYGQLNKMQALENLSSRVYTIANYSGEHSEDTYKHWMLAYSNFILVDMYGSGYTVTPSEIANSPANKNHMIAYVFGSYSDTLLKSLGWNFLGGTNGNNTPNNLENTYIGSYWQAQTVSDNSIVQENMQNMLNYIFYLMGETSVDPTGIANETPVLDSSYKSHSGVNPTQSQINTWIREDPGYNDDGAGSLNWMTNELTIWTNDTTVPTVTASPAGASYNASQDVVLTAKDNLDGNPAIYYTTDGNDPTTSSVRYTGSIHLAKTATLKFIAVDASGNQSPVESADYVIDTVAPTVKDNLSGGCFNESKNVTLSAVDDQDGSPVVYYSLDGKTWNHQAKSVILNLTGEGVTSLSFYAVDAAGNKSAIQTVNYTIDLTAPVVSDNGAVGGLFNASQSVNLTASDNLDSNPVIYYTTDGSNPTTSSSRVSCSGPVTVDKSCTLKFAAVDAGGNWSPVQSLDYVIDVTAPTVTVMPNGGCFNTTRNVTLSAVDDQDGSPVVYYSLDGKTWNHQAKSVTLNLTGEGVTSLSFYAVDAAGNKAAIQTVNYTVDLTVPTVTASPAGGSYNALQSVNLTASDNLDSNPTIYYTTDGSDPTTASTRYTGPISVVKTTTLKFIAVDAAGNHSNICNETYTIPDADVYVNSSVSETSPRVGDTVTVTLKVGNNGPDTAHGVVVTYTVPEGMEFVGATTDTPGASAPVYNVATRIVTWSIGEVPVGDPKLFVTLKVLSAGNLAGNALVTSTSHDPVSTDDTGSLTVEAVNAQSTTTGTGSTGSSTGQNGQVNTTVGESGNPVNAAETITASKVPMQKTGVPLAGLALAVLTVLGGLGISKRK